jgi:two-component system CheB/CheR fusion protein
VAVAAKAEEGASTEPGGSRAARQFGLILLTAAVYFCAAKFGLNLAFVAEQVTVVWPPTGIALAAAFLLGPGVWPGILLGAFGANATTSAPLAVAAAIAVGNTLEAIIGARILRQLHFHPGLDRVRDVLDLVAGAALISTVVSATVGTTALCAGGLQPWSSYWSLWWVWWLGDAIGDVLVGAPILVWATLTPEQRSHRPLELAILLTATLLVMVILFAALPAVGFAGIPLHYLVFPMVVWAALRHRQAGTTAVVAVASGIAITSTVNDLGPFAMATAHESLIMVQLFMVTVAATGLILAAVVMERDETSAQRARDFAALEVNEETLRLALQAARLGVWDWSIDDRIVHWREASAPIHGLLREAVGETPAQLFGGIAHPDDRAAVASSIRRALDQEGDCAVEFRTRGAAGDERWVALYGKVLGTHEGRPLRMIGTAMDITDRRRLEAELRRRVQELDIADRRKDEFLAMLAHELRNPLATLSANLQALGMTSDRPETFVQIAERQVTHLVALVNDLLDVSRISHGKITLNKEPTFLGEVIERAVELTHSLIDSRGHKLTVSLPATPVGLDVDPMRMAQAIGNLLANAATFSFASGSIELSARESRGAVEVKVRDDGIGIAPDLLPHVFELFVQGDKSLDRAGGGLGIGLTLARHLIEVHGGSVRAFSEGIGKGTEITVRLPTIPLAPATSQATRTFSQAPEAARALRILIVEDNHDTAEALARVIELWGHRVEVTFDGSAALGVAAAFEPEVIVSDLGLPGMDGYQLARGLRRRATGEPTVLVALSGYGRDEDKRRSLEAGFDYHQVKPLDLAWFGALLARVAGSVDIEKTI